MIKGGYILQPRIIQESDISVSPPYVREIWNYLLREANSKDIKYNGHEIKRGQLFRSYEDIREGTKWFIGWRKVTYNENHTKKAMKFLRDTGRITTTKELGGVLITICKYDYYQDSKNYERTTKDTTDRTIAEPLQNQPLPDNNKNDKNNKNNKEEINIPFSAFWDLYNKKVGDKKRCEKKWNSLTNEVHQKIISTIPAFISSIRDKQFQPFPETYLNQQRWNDEIKTNNNGEEITEEFFDSVENPLHLQ